ncbi:MAG TPA: SPOR domain-containing protein [Bacteroidia bacterium]|nr:SPOR domain-containing protein [Bacteroidia bacterium]
MDPEINISHYISSLLFRHDCVVVPGLGAFVCTEVPAKIHPARHTFDPPSRRIVFNKHLQQNDGLLAQTIVEESGHSFDEAMKAIAAFAEGIQQSLRAGKKTELPHIGTFSVDPEGNIGFEQEPDVNYLVEAFGLASFQSMPVIREKEKEPEVRKPVVRDIRTAPEPKPEVPAAGYPLRKLAIAASIILPLLLIGTWFTASYSKDIAGFGFFRHEPSLYKPVQWFNKTKLFSDTTGNSRLVPDQGGIARIESSEKMPPIIVDIHKVLPDSLYVASAVNSNVAPPRSSSADDHYFVIAGCFAVSQNADNFRKALQERGFHAEVVENLRSRLTHVGVGSFRTKEEADRFLSEIRRDIPEAWILRK